MVSRRRLLIAIVLPALLIPAASALRAQTAAPIWERTPYRVTVWVVVDRSTGLAATQAQSFAAALVDRCDALVGARWDVEAVECPAPLTALFGTELAEVPAERLPLEVLARDKLFVIRVGGVAGRFELAVREFDEATRSWSPVFARGDVASLGMVDEAFELLVVAFRAVARVESADEKTAELKLRGAALATRDPDVLTVPPGTVFQPLLRFNDMTGNPRKISLTAWTFVAVEALDGPAARCQIFSATRKPLSAKTRGRIDRLAIAVPRPRGGTRLELVARGAQPDPLAGYEVYAHPAGSPTTVLVGRTAADGSLWIPATDDRLRILLVKSGGEFLARLPVVPGLQGVVRAAVTDDRERLRAEGVIVSLQEGLVDLVARRALLVARMEQAIDAGRIEEAEKLLETLRAIRVQQDQFALSLRQQRQTIISSDPTVQRKIDKLFADTEKLMGQYFNPVKLAELESAVAKLRQSPPAALPAAEAPSTEGPANSADKPAIPAPTLQTPPR